jgi:hypothetical protein
MRVLTAVLAIASGVIVLMGYFIPEIVFLDQLRLLLIDWATILGGMAVLVGVANLVFVQMEKLRTKQKGGMYGVLLVFALLITFGLGFVFGIDHTFISIAMDAIIFPVEASLLAILAVTLVYASVRLIRRRTDMMTVIFLVTAVLVLLAVMPTPFGPIPVISPLILQISGMISGGGARGLLIGVALGTLLTGLRILFGIDRPYGGN